LKGKNKYIDKGGKVKIWANKIISVRKNINRPNTKEGTEKCSP
jgi:hypothetical protein